MLQTVKVFLADILTATACRSVSSLISLNRTDLLMYNVTPPVALSPGVFVIPEKPVRFKCKGWVTDRYIRNRKGMMTVVSVCRFTSV